MCGIVGYIGRRQAAPILLAGLKKLEYRGYDSAGVAVRGEGGIRVEKTEGRLARLVEKTEGGASLSGTVGIGHTRWATHGAPSEENAHPHLSDGERVTVVHNGILENFRELKQKLTAEGYVFHSETDSEVIADLIDYYLKKSGDPVTAICRFMQRARGSYALGVLFSDRPDEVFVARKDSPMILGVGKGEMFVASDVPALLGETRTVYYIDNLEAAVIRREGAVFYNIDGNVIEKQSVEVTMDASAAEKDGWEHFMIKEVHEQPRAVADTLSRYMKEGRADFSEAGIGEEEFSAERIVITACGSAYHVGVTLQYVIESLARVPVRVELASEMRYRDLVYGENCLVIAISQSGETADTLAALREAKAHGVRTVAIVNVQGSSVSREADRTIFTVAGPEIAVATTKAYSAQLAAGYLFALELARRKGTVSEEAYAGYIKELLSLPEKIKRVLERKEAIGSFAARHQTMRDVFMIGRGVDYSVCLEGSLKLKEISYVHTEAYAAGELKHGTISLIEEGTVVVGLLLQPRVREKTASNLEEVRSRGAHVVAMVFEGEKAEGAAEVWEIPKTEELFAASVAVVPLQLLAYYVSLQRGLDVDKPRNLAKSVTVE